MERQGNRRGQSSRSKSRIVEFKRIAPPTYEGSADPTKSLKQLKEMEKAFASMECTDQEKVLYYLSITKKSIRMVESYQAIVGD